MVFRHGLNLFGAGSSQESMSIVEKAEQDAHCTVYQEERVCYVSSDSIIALQNWLFTFFNKNVPYDEIKEFNQKFKLLLKHRKLAEALSDDLMLKKLKRLYEKVFRQKNLNNTSIATSCSPFTRGEKESRIIVYRNNGISCRIPRRYRYRPDFYTYKKVEVDRPSIVLTGDLTVPQIWEPMSRKFKIAISSADRTNVVLYQIPHHGSDHNWHTPQGVIPDNPVYVLSAGRKNRYRHPSMKVLKSLMACGKNLVWCSEMHEFSLRIEFQML